MRTSLALIALFSLPALARAQAEGSALDPESYAALAADDHAQMSLGGFRRYLERIEEGDALLYRQLDPRLDDLESREVAADAIFWTSLGLSVAALVTAIPIETELGRSDIAIGLVIAGVSTFLVGIIVQAIVRPGHGDLVRLIDVHDELVGRR
jgi:hypothetical protein